MYGGVKLDVENLAGEVFGHLVVLKLNNKHRRGSSWLCQCDCGKEIILYTSRLIGLKNRKPDKSCGCKNKRQNRKTKEYPRVYRIWKNMVSRCHNPTQTGYERYGGKGIRVCDEWRYSFQTFLEWALDNGYSDVLTIDRIESMNPYGPSNCRWSDYFTQEANRGMHKDNTTGHKGVAPLNGKFRAYLTRMKRNKHLGTFDTIEEAAGAREKALRQYELYGML